LIDGLGLMGPMWIEEAKQRKGRERKAKKGKGKEGSQEGRARTRCHLCPRKGRRQVSRTKVLGEEKW